MKFRETRQVGAELFHVDRQTDRQTDMTKRFSQFCDSAAKRSTHTAIFEALNGRVVQGSVLTRWNAVSVGEWLLASRCVSGRVAPGLSRDFDAFVFEDVLTLAVGVTCQKT